MALRSSMLHMSSALMRAQRQQTLRMLPCVQVPARMFSEKYSTRMKKTGRPVSPHVTIYAFPMAALSSITVRVTGVALSVGLGGVGAAELVGFNSAELAMMIGNTAVLGPAAKFAVAYTLVYHWLGAARHYAWDSNPELLQNKPVKYSSVGILAGAGVIAGALALM